MLLLGMKHKKTCSKCHCLKEIDCFSIDKSRPDGHSYVCKECSQCRGKDWYSKNRAANYKRSRAWACANETRIKELRRNWGKANADKERDRQKIAQRVRRLSAKGTLNNNISCAVWRCLSGMKARKSWQSLLDFTVDELKLHLECQFLSGMSWNNRNDWDIDHIIPLAAFNFERPTDIDFKKAWALKNLRPMWKSDNRRKGASLKAPFQPSLAF